MLSTAGYVKAGHRRLPLAGRCPKGDAAGASPKEVAARAGHTSVSFVLDRYGHLFPEADTALRARLDSLFRAATEHRRNTVA